MPEHFLPPAATLKTSLSRNSSFPSPLMWFAYLVWLVLLIALSVSPLSFKLKLHTTGKYHNFGHYAVYVVSALLVCTLSRRFAGRLLGFCSLLAVALTQEWLENHMYHAGYEWKDVATDLAGIVSGFALVTLVTVLFSDSERRGLR